MKKNSVMAAVLLIMASMVLAQSGGDYAIKKSLIGGGGGKSIGDSYQLTGSIGQKITAVSDGGEYHLSTGFWQKNADLIFFSYFE